MHGKATAAPSARETRPEGEAGAVVVSLPTERKRRRPTPRTALERIVAALDPVNVEVLGQEIAAIEAVLSPATDRRGGPGDAPGIEPRHRKRCRSNVGAVCDCTPTWAAWVHSRVDKKKLRKTFPTKREAEAWRRRMLDYADQGRLREPTQMTLAAAGKRWLEMARAGEITNRSGRRYKPSALRNVEQDLRLRLVPDLGAHRVAEITRSDLQRRVGAWLAQGLSPSKVRATVNAARVVFRDFDLITGTDNPLINDPTRCLRLPRSDGKRERIASPDEARRLIEALEPGDRALWAAAMDAGLRHGELKALRCCDLDLDHDRIHVRRGWDQYEGEIEPKSESGKRTTCVSARLKRLLQEHLERTERSHRDRVFGDIIGDPFVSTSVNTRARRAWAAARVRDDEEGALPEQQRIRPIGLHECRHTAVSQMLDAGISIDKVSKFMGHASITITIDRYGHLLPGGEAEAAALLDAYHERKRRPS